MDNWFWIAVIAAIVVFGIWGPDKKEYQYKNEAASRWREVFGSPDTLQEQAAWDYIIYGDFDEVDDLDDITLEVCE